MKKLLLASLMLITTIFAADFGKVVALQGEVTYGGKKAVLGQLVKPNKTLVTKNSNDYVDVLFPDNTVLRLEYGTSTFKKIGKQTQISLLSGKLYVKVKRVLKEKESFEIKTPTSVVGVRGTAFLIEEQKEASYICVCEGVVEATSLTTKEVRQVKKDEDLWIKKDKPVKDPVLAPDMSKMTQMVFDQMESASK